MLASAQVPVEFIFFIIFFFSVIPPATGVATQCVFRDTSRRLQLTKNERSSPHRGRFAAVLCGCVCPEHLFFFFSLTSSSHTSTVSVSVLEEQLRERKEKKGIRNWIHNPGPISSFIIFY